MCVFVCVLLPFQLVVSVVERCVSNCCRTPTEAMGPQKVQDLEMREEWQDDEFPRFEL